MTELRARAATQQWAEVYTKIFPAYQLLIESYLKAQDVVKITNCWIRSAKNANTQSPGTMPGPAMKTRKKHRFRVLLFPSRETAPCYNTEENRLIVMKEK